MIYHLALNFNHLPVVLFICISALIVALITIKEKNHERKRA